MAKKTEDLFTSCEYIQVTDNGKTLLHLDGELCNGKSDTWLREKIGDELGEGYYSVVVKILGKRARNRTLRAFTRKENKELQKPFDYQALSNKIEVLASKVDKSSGANSLFDFEKLLNLQTKIFDQQLSFLTLQLESTQKQLAKGTVDKGTDIDISQILSIVSLLKGQTMPTSLKDQPVHISNVTLEDLPEPLRQTLDKVDYKKLTPEQIEQVNEIFKKFISSSLPTKEQ